MGWTIEELGFDSQQGFGYFPCVVAASALKATQSNEY
jgi:hypothetical protein